MTTPKAGTPEHDVWVAALDVAVAAPRRQSTYAHCAQVPWSLIKALRAALDGVGVDWAGVKEARDAR